MAKQKSLDSLLELELANLGPWYDLDLEYPPGGAITRREPMNNVDIIYDYDLIKDKSIMLEMIPKEETAEFAAALNQLISKGSYEEASAHISQSVLEARAALKKHRQERHIRRIPREEIDDYIDRWVKSERQYAGMVTASAPALLRMTQLTSERKYLQQAVRLMTMLDKDKRPLGIVFGNDMAQFAQYFLLPMAETEQIIIRFIVQSYIRNGDYDRALQAMRDTPCGKYTEDKVLEIARKFIYAKKSLQLQTKQQPF